MRPPRLRPRPRPRSPSQRCVNGGPAALLLFAVPLLLLLRHPVGSPLSSVSSEAADFLKNRRDPAHPPRPWAPPPPPPPPVPVSVLYPLNTKIPGIPNILHFTYAFDLRAPPASVPSLTRKQQLLATNVADIARLHAGMRVVWTDDAGCAALLEEYGDPVLAAGFQNERVAG